VLVGVLPSEVWRIVGMAVGRSLDEKSEPFVWLKAVATGLLAAVIAELVLAPPGQLAALPISVRLGATLAGFLGFLLLRRSTFSGLLIGVGALVIGALLFSG
jgi:hypothetical protein